MRPPLVTESEVLEAARRVRTRGKEINGWSIRRELGDRGNPRRLLAVWTAKGDAAPPAAEPVDTVSLPAPLLELVAAAQTALTTELDTIVRTIHRHAREDADATFRRITDDLQASEQRIKEQLDLAEASVDATETEMDRRGDAIASLGTEIGEARVQIAGLTERERQALDRAQEAETQTAALQAERDSLTRASQLAREAQTGAEAQAAAMRDEVGHLRAALERAEAVRQTDVGRVTAELAAARQQIEEARDAHQAEIATARQQATAAQATERTLRAEQERTLADLAAERTERRQAETALQTAQRTVADAEQRSAVLTAELAEVGRGRQIAEERVTALEAERRGGEGRTARAASTPPKAGKAAAPAEDGDSLL
ncbi:hypothetical protein E2C06_12160 [Dankookia rubra]|uniref:KfrA N-terminal DNA-binding domain-containing protein n=1 Tax=Dankookia rubra TaxID=1442381 RepID=A0A4V3AAA5_9PROT|nr:DNA-binding protein [Dankookia rubra]TDH62355.1 hypothetical protein E2C06_12160 [Dankookia rubra]